MKKRKSLLDLDSQKARDFFLKQESYCNIDLPSYFVFSDLLKKLAIELNDKTLASVSNVEVMKKLDNIHYILYTNKDGKLSWRPLQILHPVVYVALIHHITEEANWSKIKSRFTAFQQNPQIRCLSIPVEANNKQSDKAQQIRQWWEEVEQESINLSLDYNVVFETDITDCYSSISTHSIAWAIETKEIAKGNHKTNLLGNFIDKSIQIAQNQQTNGIPQGSVLMDFIAEMVLGYVDELLSVKLQENCIEDYHILRYRDDYRIFVNNYDIGESIIKMLSEVLMPFGLKLNASKTKCYQDVIIASIKQDKLSWLPQSEQKLNDLSLQKHLLLIKQHSLQYPNSGSLTVALNNFYQQVKKQKSKTLIAYFNQIISIVTDIAYHNPKCIAVCCAIISQFLSLLKNDVHKNIMLKVYNKLQKAPNSGFSQIWLQRVLKNNTKEIDYTEPLCHLVCGNKGTMIWNHSWINDQKLLAIIKQETIFNKAIFDDLKPVMASDEIDLFSYSNR